MTRDEPEEREAPPPRESDDSGRTVRIVVGVVAVLAIAGTLLAGAVWRSGSSGCGDWEQQFDQLSEALALYMRAKGQARAAALENLQALELPCAKVAETREVCSSVYGHLQAAEVEHARAKVALSELERAISGLDEPVRTVAERRYIESEPAFVIAEKLEMPPEEVRRHLSAAEETIGARKIGEIHDRFESAVKRSKDHVDAARTGNAQCDAAYKLLLEEEQQQ